MKGNGEKKRRFEADKIQLFLEIIIFYFIKLNLILLIY